MVAHIQSNLPGHASDPIRWVEVSTALLEELRTMRTQVSLLQQQGNVVTRRLAQFQAPVTAPTPPVEWQARIAEIEMAAATLRPELDRLRAELLEARIAAQHPAPKAERLDTPVAQPPPPEEDMTELVRCLSRELSDLRADSYRLFSQNPHTAVNAIGAGSSVTIENLTPTAAGAGQHRKRRYRRSSSVMSIWQAV